MPRTEKLVRMMSLGLVGLLASCGNEASEPEPPVWEPAWEMVQEDLPGALLSLWGNADGSDLWAVGADARDGSGPVVLRRQGEGSTWQRMQTGLEQGSLWWVFGFDEGPVYLGGEGGLILRYADGQFSTMEVPGNNTVYGIWGASPDDVWAVGGASESAGGFAWRLQGGSDRWLPEASLPESVSSGAAVWKIFGTARDDAWLVGSNGVALHWNGQALILGDTGVGTSLFTVHANAQRYAAVGGFGTGFIVEYEVEGNGTWTNVFPESPPVGLSGVCLGEGESGIAVGIYGSVYRRSAAGWQLEDLGFGLNETLHSAWIDPDGGIWAVGGWTFEEPPTQGIMIHQPPPATGSL